MSSVARVSLPDGKVLEIENGSTCAKVAASYELEVDHRDGAVTRHAVEIEVVAP